MHSAPGQLWLSFVCPGGWAVFRHPVPQSCLVSSTMDIATQPLLPAGTGWGSTAWTQLVSGCPGAKGSVEPGENRFPGLQVRAVAWVIEGAYKREGGREGVS